MNVLQMSVQAATMIAFIVIIRALGMGRLPKWSFQALWGLALLRALLPMNIESPLSVYGALDAVQAARTMQPPTVLNGITSHGMTLNPIVEQTAQLVVQVPGLSFSPWMVAWVAVTLAMVGFFLSTHIRCRRIYAQSLPLQTIRERGRTISVRTSDRIGSPLTYGILRPVILLPKQFELGSVGLSYVSAHELAHIHHFDALKKWLLTAALCVHWFNPLVWVMFILANRDIELSCDESVLRKLHDDARVSYATMLIDLMQRRGGQMPLASYFGRNATEERIVSIMKHKKTSFVSVVVAIALLLTTGVALATSTVKPVPPPVVAPYEAIPEQPALIENTPLDEEVLPIPVEDVLPFDDEPDVVEADGTPDWWYDANTQTWTRNSVPIEDSIEWWTADEYEAWLNVQRAELPKLIGTRTYWEDTGWFTWTQKEVDGMIALYESNLADIRMGAHYSKDGIIAEDIGIRPSVEALPTPLDVASTTAAEPVLAPVEESPVFAGTISESEEVIDSPHSPRLAHGDFSVADVDFVQLDYNAIASAMSAIGFDGLEPGQAVRDSTLYEIHSGTDRLAFQINWASSGNAIRVGLLSEDGDVLYATTLERGSAAGAISTDGIPSGKYYIAVQNIQNGYSSITGAISYCWN